MEESDGSKSKLARITSIPFGGVIAYVKQHFSNDPFVGVENTCYGECVLLNSGKKVAFYYDQTCVGYEMDIKGESSLPQPVREFTENTFRMEPLRL